MLKRLCLIILIILSVTGLLSITPACAEERYGFLLKWGGGGTESGKFAVPWGLTIDSNNNVYIVDTWLAQVLKFTDKGEFIFKWGKGGKGNGEFIFPGGITADLNDNIYVADTGNADTSNDRVQKFTKEGVFITKWGSYGTNTGQFKYPFDIAVDSYGNVYVVDCGNDRIQKFTKEGIFITQWGEEGFDIGKFKDPVSIAIDSKNNIYVSDRWNHRIQKFTSSGEFITKWGSYGEGDGQFYCPFGIAVDSNDNIYVIDANNYRIQKFYSSGEFITKWGSYGEGDGQFKEPVSIELDRNDNVYVGDGETGYIQKFIPLSLPPDGDYFIPVYPNPCKINLGHKYIVFGKSDEVMKRLPESGTIKIYTIVGELVKILNITPADGGMKKWYINNEDGKEVTSGIYIYCITDSEERRKCTGKIGIIR